MNLVDILSGILLLAGSSLVVVSAIGVLRFKDTFMKLHASSVAETGGLLLLVAGMLLQCPNWLVAVKLIIVALVLMLTNPVSSHALARAALYDGYRPNLGDGAELAAGKPEIDRKGK